MSEEQYMDTGEWVPSFKQFVVTLKCANLIK